MISTRQGLINQEETDTEMDRISEALEMVFHSQTKKLSFQKTYHSVYRLCRQGLHQELADLATKKITDHFRTVINEISASEKRIGQVVDKTITNLMEISQRILEIFLYLEANHRQREGALSLRIVFNNVLFETLTKRRDVMERFVFEIAELKISGELEKAKKLIGLVANVDENETFISQSFLPVYIPRMKDFFRNSSEEKMEFYKHDLKSYLWWAIDMLENEKDFMSSVVSRSRLEAKQEFDSVMN